MEQAIAEVMSRSELRPDRPVIIGLTGAPGSGKSTLSARLVDAFNRRGHRTVLVPQDGFHLSNAELSRFGRSDRKGAPDTFDVGGFCTTLKRAQQVRASGETVWCPKFHREIEESFAAEIAVEPTTEVIITEGNYLLFDQGGWEAVSSLLDTAWYIAASDDNDRVRRLIARHVSHGRTLEQATEWVLRSDEANARIIEGTRHRAHQSLALLPDLNLEDFAEDLAGDIPENQPDINE